jgi:hypothetical protein
LGLSSKWLKMPSSALCPFAITTPLRPLVWSDAVIVLFGAGMADVLTEDQKRRILTDSGEFARWEECRAETPEDEEVLYPPLPLSAEDLMRLAISADRAERRRANILLDKQNPNE